MTTKLRKEVVLGSLLLAVVAAGSVAAHEGHTHMAQGTVKVIAAERLDLAQQEGKVDSFVLTSSTRYLRGQAAEKREGVRVGERAVVHYEEREGKKVAKEVRLGGSNKLAAAGSDAEKTVQLFHDALAAGDSAAALRLLAPEVVIFEEGGVENSREEYRAHHLQADVEFSRATKREVLDRHSAVMDRTAWVLTQARVSGTFRDRKVDADLAETVALEETADGWRIRHIHWSSRERQK
jgi:ketosteroid isomerase-like protein